MQTTDGFDGKCLEAERGMTYKKGAWLQRLEPSASSLGIYMVITSKKEYFFPLLQCPASFIRKYARSLLMDRGNGNGKKGGGFSSELWKHDVESREDLGAEI